MFSNSGIQSFNVVCRRSDCRCSDYRVQCVDVQSVDVESFHVQSSLVQWFDFQLFDVQLFDVHCFRWIEIWIYGMLWVTPRNQLGVRYEIVIGFHVSQVHWAVGICCQWMLLCIHMHLLSIHVHMTVYPCVLRCVSITTWSSILNPLRPRAKSCSVWAENYSIASFNYLKNI